VRRNTEEVQGGGTFAVFDELFADDFVDHTPQPSTTPDPGTTPDKDGVRHLSTMLRQAFPDFASILELEGDKIRRESDYWDAATFMQQVGLLPSQR